MKLKALIVVFSMIVNHVFGQVEDVVDRLVQDNNAFALRLYSSVQQQPGNIIFSPYSISSALAMVYAGASGETEKQMKQALGFTLDQSDLHSAFASLNKSLTTFTSDISSELNLKIANSLWLERGLNLLPEFSTIISKQYLGAIQRTNFKEPETSRAEINRWVKEHTNGKITDLLTSSSISQNTQMVLASAIYFKARWEALFDPKFTHVAPFFPNPNQTLTVSMLEKAASYRYLDGDGFSMVEIPYFAGHGSSKQFLFLMILPHEKGALKAVEKKITTQKILEWQAAMSLESVRVILPKFSMSEGVELNHILESMGMPIAFSKQADFSKMTTDKSLQIGDVSHKAYIAVDEYGTEAAAATSVSMQVTSIQHKKPIEFRADHPFIFIILDKDTKAILFLGRVVKP